MLQFLHEDAFFACFLYFSPLHLRDMNHFRSCRYMENRSGDRFSPSRTLMLQVQKYDCASVVNATLDLAFLHMFLMTSDNFLKFQMLASLTTLFIVSNAFL